MLACGIDEPLPDRHAAVATSPGDTLALTQTQKRQSTSARVNQAGPAYSPAKRSYGDWLIAAAFTICGIWALCMAGVGWNNSLSDAHGFRQTQTAITSYYLTPGAPLWSYETPVVGPPWSIPFEFPLYQWIVAASARVLKTPLDQTGRFVSEAFFALAVVTLWKILAELGVRRIDRLVFLTLLIVSPEYVFWSRTFLIESTALCFGMAYLLFVIRYIRSRRIADALIGGIFGVLTAIVKAPSFPGFCLAGALCYLLETSRADNSRPPSRFFRRHGLAVGLFAAVPILAALAWTRHADQVKALNTVGAHMTSRGIRDFTFGTLSLRLDASTWRVFFERIIPDLLGTGSILLVATLALLLGRRRASALVCAFAFLFVFLVFTSVHVIHSYYTYASGVFLIAAVGWSIVGLLENGLFRRAIGLAVFVVCVSGSVIEYYAHYHIIQKKDALALNNLVQAVKRVTNPRDVILVFGQDWSSEIPYYSQRRALMWPQWMVRNWDSPALKEAVGRLSGNHIGALILCYRARRDVRLLEKARRGLGLRVNPEFEDRTCTLYAASGLAEE